MSQLMERMAPVLWLALASCILTLASTEQQGECSAHLASQMPCNTRRVSREVQRRCFRVSEERGMTKAKAQKPKVEGNKMREAGIQSQSLKEPNQKLPLKDSGSQLT